MSDHAGSIFGEGQSFVVKYNGKIYVTHGSWEYEAVAGADTTPELRQTLDALQHLLGTATVVPVAVSTNDATISGQIVHPGGPNLKLHTPKP